MDEHWHKMYRGPGLFLMREASRNAWELWTRLSYCTKPYDNTVYIPGTSEPMTRVDVAKFWERKDKLTRDTLTELVELGALSERRKGRYKVYMISYKLCYMGKGSASKDSKSAN